MKRIFLLMIGALGSLLPAMAQETQDHDFETSKNLEIFNAIYRNLDMAYVDTLSAGQTIGTGIQAMLQSLDPYTVYYPAEKVNELKSTLTGKYAGIGALICYNSKLKRVVVDEPYQDTPAAEAGLKKGDIILSIDDTTMTDKDVSYVSSHLRGDAGTTFLLKIQRPSTGKILQKRITRRAIQFPSIPYYGLRKNGVGYINLNSFTEDCSRDFRRAFIDLKQKGMKALVIDLRGNGGGLLSEAVSIVNMFVPNGKTIVKTIGKLKRGNHEYRTTVEPIDTVMPVVVMVNGETASASEITSGSLQDFDRAVVLGTRTYGKGLVQTPLDLPYNAQMKLTTSKYYIPSGRCIQAINYKHANGGYLEHIPDSLTKVFHTANGREVRDGGGIKPDLEVKPDSLPNIAYYLSASGRDSTEVMLEYVMDYIERHPTIAPAEDFSLTDADYAEFKQRVLKSGFTYDPESEKVMKRLKQMMEFEGYMEDAKPEFEALEKKLAHNLDKDLDRHKALIMQLLQNDIVAAYYYQAGSIANTLQYDKQMKAAEELLLDTERYRQMLQP
ncbi:MAG: S41 family peptidase [Prevotella sp.]|nr:S41 family peptidase [Prevotella sp.]